MNGLTCSMNSSYYHTICKYKAHITNYDSRSRLLDFFQNIKYHRRVIYAKINFLNAEANNFQLMDSSTRNTKLSSAGSIE